MKGERHGVSDTVIAARVADTEGHHRLTLVHYACHPTTLAWENTLISPDYVGALRETVEHATSGPCLFFQGPCGDLGPKDGFTGDIETADRNGRQVGYAALSALSSLGPPATDFVYTGPVVSGATLGIWKHLPMSGGHKRDASVFRGDAFYVDLPLKDLPKKEALEADLQRFTREQSEADAAGDAGSARDFGARAERCRRWLGRIQYLPAGNSFHFHCTAWRLGDAIWATCSAEPYNILQGELRTRFPNHTLLVSPVAGDGQVAYLLPADRYGQGLYQEEPSSLAPGCLEILIDAMAMRIRNLLEP